MLYIFFYCMAALDTKKRSFLRKHWYISLIYIHVCAHMCAHVCVFTCERVCLCMTQIDIHFC